MVKPELIAAIRSVYRLDWNGLHGFPHWQRVCENGERLCQMAGVHSPVVPLFAYLHDSRRQNDGWDPLHGARGARFARKLWRDGLLPLSVKELELLTAAIDGHAQDRTRAHPIIQLCWDSDRLDLGRAGIHPDPERLCTEFAKKPDVIAWAYQRSVNGS